MVHEVKIEPEYFEKVISGLKTFEVRLNDRNYKKGDLLVLREWKNKVYTGRSVQVNILDVYSGVFCLEGYCIISFCLPVSSQMMPVSAYFALYDLYLQVCKELDILKEGKV